MSKVKRGDTLLEVVFAFALFSLVTVITISAMNSGIARAEASLELTLARTEIDSQSETLRFIQSAFANDRAYSNLWHKIIAHALDKDTVDKAPSLSVSSCGELYDTSKEHTIYGAKAFVINPRHIGDSLDDTSSNYYEYSLISADSTASVSAWYATFSTSSLNPRLVYTDRALDPSTSDDALKETELFTSVDRVEGIYDFVVPDLDHTTPYYYDFYIYTCWVAPGAERPTTIGTVTRLYNPEFNK